MTKEQEEAIEIVNNFIKMDFNNQLGWTGYYDTELKELSEAVETVLSMLQEQQEENKKKDKIINEQLKEDVKLQAELNTENNRCMILANNNKFKEQMIDLMAEIFYKRFKAELLLEYGFESEEQLKQYFERKVEDVKN